jgi:hypothetical protein
MMAILGVDWFWSVWLAAVVSAEVLAVYLNLPRLAPSWLYEFPLYIGLAGLTSLVYAIGHEVIAHPPVGKEVAKAQERDRPKPASTGESMVPAGAGLALLTFAIFLDGAIYRGDPLVAVVGLPLVFVTAPFFAMFTFGYVRGQPDVGGFAYRKMPFGLAGFLGASGLVLVSRWQGWDPSWVLYLAAVIGIISLGINLGINWQRERPGD